MAESLNSDPLTDKIHRRTSVSSFEERNGHTQVHSDKYNIDNLNSSTRRLMTKFNQISDSKNVVFPKQEPYKTLKNASSSYLTLNPIDQGKSTFQNGGILPDSSPGIFSVKTISTSALNDMLYWDNSTDIINNKTNPRKNSEISNGDISVPNRIYEISGNATLQSDSKLSRIVTSDGKRDVNIVTPPSNGEKFPQIRYSRTSPQITQAAELLRSDIYSSSSAEQFQKLPLRLDVSKNSKTVWQQNDKDNIRYVALFKHIFSSYIEARELEKYSGDSSVVYNSPKQSVSTILQNSAETNSWSHTTIEGRNTNYIIRNENDRAESPQSATPSDREKNMPFQHVDYNSVISLDSTNPTFDNIFSTWKIAVVLVTCIVIPPLFYIIHYAGHGGMSDEQVERMILRDSYLRDPLRGFYWDVDIVWFKKICFYLGTIECFLIVGCICVGFAVGLTKGQ